MANFWNRCNNHNCFGLLISTCSWQNKVADNSNGYKEHCENLCFLMHVVENVYFLKIKWLIKLLVEKNICY